MYKEKGNYNTTHIIFSIIGISSKAIAKPKDKPKGRLTLENDEHNDNKSSRYLDTRLKLY